MSALNLAMHSATNSRSKEILEQVDGTHWKLDEIYKCFVQNLQTKSQQEALKSSQTHGQGTVLPDPNEILTFTIKRQDRDGTGERICPMASFRTDLLQKPSAFGSKLFSCLCSQLRGSLASTQQTAFTHSELLELKGTSDLSNTRSDFFFVLLLF